MIYKGFLTDFTFWVNDHSEHLKLNNQRLDFFHAYEVMKDLGMIRAVARVDVDIERARFVEMWREMKGDENNGVRPGNL